jgi:hypothetical protein
MRVTINSGCTSTFCSVVIIYHTEGGAPFAKIVGLFFCSQGSQDPVRMLIEYRDWEGGVRELCSRKGMRWTTYVCVSVHHIGATLCLCFTTFTCVICSG